MSADNTSAEGGWHGWLVLDKPVGMTSAHAVAKVKKLLKPRKIGHGGTLDPLATGILPLALGEATKLFAYVAANTKAYRFTVRWGEERATDDSEGDVVQASDARPSQAEIEAILPAFVGEAVMQVPPVFSAIKQDGKRAYAVARKGGDVVLEARPVNINSLKLLDIADPNHATFELVCGKGTYVRAVARDMGRKLGCFGHVSMLRRTMVGKFSENDAISLEMLGDLVHSGALKARLLPMASVLDDIPALEIDRLAVHRLTHGQSAVLPPAHWRKGEEPRLVLATCQGHPIAMVEADQGEIRPVRVFNLT